MDGGLPDDVAAGILARDPDAVAACYQELADPLFRYLLALCRDRSLAEDLVEATFLELVETAPRLTGGARAVRAWLFRAARNNFLDARRKEIRRRNVPLDEHVAAERPAGDPGPEDVAITNARNAMLWEALGQLSPDQREVLTLRFAGGLSGPEIAAVTGRTVGAVKALQHRGLASLARRLGANPGYVALQ
jgi:RNA polymerase sigma-70 factor (ECF subfamily)